MSDQREYSPAELAYLDQLQGAIGRMAGASFQFKAWSITLVVAVLAFVDKDSADALFACAFALVPAVLFWRLDLYFLRAERTYRFAFEWGVVQARRVPVFELHPARIQAQMTPTEARQLEQASGPLRWFHGVLIALPVLTGVGAAINLFAT